MHWQTVFWWCGAAVRSAHVSTSGTDTQRSDAFCYAGRSVGRAGREFHFRARGGVYGESEVFGVPAQRFLWFRRNPVKQIQVFCVRVCFERVRRRGAYS